MTFSALVVTKLASFCRAVVVCILIISIIDVSILQKIMQNCKNVLQIMYYITYSKRKLCGTNWISKEFVLSNLQICGRLSALNEYDFFGRKRSNIF